VNASCDPITSSRKQTSTSSSCKRRLTHSAFARDASRAGHASAWNSRAFKSELKKQIKVNADALLEHDTKITVYTARMQELMDKQATVITDMQKQMGDSEAAHVKALSMSINYRSKVCTCCCTSYAPVWLRPAACRQ
jgi:hypothetical protein